MIERLAKGAALLTACVLLLGANAAQPAEPGAIEAVAEEPEAALVPSRKRVLVIPIHGPINRLQGAFLHRVLAGAKDDFDAVIFDIDTPGGRSDIMSQMSKEIRDLSPTPTIAFVSNWALSAGSFIAMSCDRIYMVPGAIIGAARGYVPGPDGLPVKLPASVEEKFTSVNRAQFRALASEKGYPPAIAEGMTDETIEVKKVVYEGKERYLTGHEVAEIEADPLKKERLKVIRTVSPAGRLITLTAQEAAGYDIAQGILADLDAVLEAEHLAEARLTRREQNWSDKAVAVLTAPGIVALLVLIAFAALWIELKVPGFGVPGTISVIAFLVVFGSQFLVGNADALEILLFLIGGTLLVIEVFVTPGFGVIGGAGILCVFLSLILSMQPFAVPQAPWEFQVFQFNLLATFGGVAGSLIVLLFAIWLLPTTPLFARLAVKKELRAEDGYTSGAADGEALVGQAGTVVTPLRPAGKMEIADRTYSVVSDAEFVKEGRKVRVVRVDGPRIVVVPLEPEKPREPDFQP